MPTTAKKEIIKVERLPDLTDAWRVHYRSNGLIYWKIIKASDEMEAFMKVTGIRK
jgi:hypothetical protein